MILQRPVAPAGLPSVSSFLTNATGKSRASKRRRCGGIVVAFSIVALGAIFFMAEWRTETLIVASSASANESGAQAVASKPPEMGPSGDQIEGSQPEEGTPEAGGPDGLPKTFDSFRAFVDESRERKGSGRPSVVPVVELGGRSYTLPSLIIAGAERSGTSSLYGALSQHPAVAALARDPSGVSMAHEPERYPADAEWPGDGLETELPAETLGDLFESYASPFTFSQARLADEQTPVVPVESRPEYLASPLAPYRLKVALPDVKIVILLRDPVERYLSALKVMLCEDADKVDWEDIESSFAQPSRSKEYVSTAVFNYSPYDKRCLGEGASAADLWACQEASVETHRPLLKGLYAGQVARWIRVFGSSQVKIVNSADLFANPEMVIADVVKFAGLQPHVVSEYAVDRRASCDPRQRGRDVASAYAKRSEAEPTFRQWYSQHNTELFDDLGQDFQWNDRIRSMKGHPQQELSDPEDRSSR